MLQNVWLIPVVPILGALINGVLGRRLGRKAVSVVACGSVGAAFFDGNRGVFWS